MPGPDEAGPSRPKKGPKKPIALKKARKISEKQRIEALERDAMNFEAPDDLKSFADLPISEYTKRGLKKAFFVDMTDIQAKSLPVSLKGKDVLGAARTGSGKTLAFLIPVLEILYRRKWGLTDGLGALIISPTRELAVQIFEVLRSIGGYHSFSAGLVIGGKNLKDERDRLAKMNILVATPGRLLQHMDQTIGFESDNLQLLILDEADRILDMGFSRTLSALLSHLPKSRQTLLFSATQTQSIADLARLSLKDPVSIGIDQPGSDGPSSSTPQNLEQHYLVCTLDQKLSLLFSFIRSHLQSKTLVFLSSCKQVRFVFSTFCKMHPGVPLLHLHGQQKQTTRLVTYNKFVSSSFAVLIATDIASRGLDFPAVDWVLQVDCPEDADTYIHRVGRTARYESKGKGLLFLMPSEEEGMLAALAKKGVEVKKIKARPSKTVDIENKLQKLAFEDPEIKYLGQRAFVSYLRSVHLHKDKAVFKLAELPAERFAESLGLPGAPKIKFLSKELAKQKKNASRSVAAAQAEVLKEKETKEEEAEDSDEDDGDVHSSSEEEEVDVPAKPTKPTVRTKYDRMFERKNQNVLSAHYTKLIDHDDAATTADADEDDDFITLARADHDLPPTSDPQDNDKDILAANLSKRKLKLGRAKRALLLTSGVNKKLVFDEAGRARAVYEVQEGEEWVRDKGGVEGVFAEGRRFVEGERGKMREADVKDKEEAREKKQEKKRKRKEREKGADAGDLDPVIGSGSDDGYVSPEFDLPSSGDEDNESAPPPAKRSKLQTPNSSNQNQQRTRTIEDEEELALRFLRKKR